MGGTKKLSFPAEYRHKKWVEKMQKNFTSPESKGYWCSSCGARCSTNNWEYHTFEQDRGVLCFYSTMNQLSHNDYIKYGVSGMRGVTFEHNVNLADRVKVLEGVAVKVSYDQGVVEKKKDTEIEDEGLVASKSVQALNSAALPCDAELQSSCQVVCLSSDNDLLTNKLASAKLQKEQSQTDVSLINPDTLKSKEVQTESLGENKLLSYQNASAEDGKKSTEPEKTLCKDKQEKLSCETGPFEIIYYPPHTGSNSLADKSDGAGPSLYKAAEPVIENEFPQRVNMAMMNESKIDKRLQCNESGFTCAFLEQPKALQFRIVTTNRITSENDEKVPSELLDGNNNDIESKSLDHTQDGMPILSVDTEIPHCELELTEPQLRCKQVHGKTSDAVDAKLPFNDVSTVTSGGHHGTINVTKTQFRVEQFNSASTFDEDVSTSSNSEPGCSDVHADASEESREAPQTSKTPLNSAAEARKESGVDRRARPESHVCTDSREPSQDNGKESELDEATDTRKDPSDAEEQLSRLAKSISKESVTQLPLESQSNDEGENILYSSSDESFESCDEPDFGQSIKKKLKEFKRKMGPEKEVTPCDQEEKIYYCVSCVMKTGKVWNEVRNICVHFGIEIDQLYFDK